MLAKPLMPLRKPAGRGGGAVERLQEALMGLEIVAKGQRLLAQARLANAMAGG